MSAKGWVPRAHLQEPKLFQEIDHNILPSVMKDIPCFLEGCIDPPLKTELSVHSYKYRD